MDGIKIGIFGLGIELKGLISKSHYKETRYLNPIEIAQDMTQFLKDEQGCDLIICLSHLGYKYNNNKISDMVLASKTKDIDLIIGGHTHTFLEKPTIVENSDNKSVIINQVGCFGINLGRIDFYFESGKSNVNGRSIEI